MKRNRKEESCKFKKLYCELKTLKESSSRDEGRFNEILSEMESLASNLGFDERAVVAHAKDNTEYWEGLEEFFQFEEDLKNGKYD